MSELMSILIMSGLTEVTRALQGNRGYHSAPGGERRELLHCVPVARGPAAAEVLFDDGDRELRSPLAVGIRDVGVTPARADDLTSCDRVLQRRDRGTIHRLLQAHHDE